MLTRIRNANMAAPWRDASFRETTTLLSSTLTAMLSGAV
jgi:hypothetical protein